MNKFNISIKRNSISFFIASAILLAQSESSFASQMEMQAIPQGDEIEMLPDDEAQIAELQSETNAYMDDTATAPVITSEFKAQLANSEAQLEKFAPVKGIKVHKHSHIRKHS